MLAKGWRILRDSVQGFIADEALSRGAAIAFYSVTSIGPLLVIVVAIAGLAFGQEAAQGAIVGQLTGLMGQQSAAFIEAAIAGASSPAAGVTATVIGFVTLLLTATGVFGEMQAALNAIWKAQPRTGTVTRLIRARAASLGLVAALGFLMLVSLAVSAAISALGDWLSAAIPFGGLLLQIINFLVSLALIAVLFTAIYKVLPDVPLEWGDVIVGGVATAVLFTIGKTLIGLYIGSSAVASSYGAAGALIVVLLWIYYSAQIFLLGAEFTRAYAESDGSRRAAAPATAASRAAAPRVERPREAAARTGRRTVPLAPRLMFLNLALLVLRRARGGARPAARR